MNLITAKAISDINLKGLKLAWEKHDSTIKFITLTDVDGVTIRISSIPYGDGIKVLVPEPPKKTDKYFLHGEIAGIPLKKAFDTEREAKDAADDLGSAAVVQITKAEVTVDEAGVPDMDEVPF